MSPLLLLAALLLVAEAAAGGESQPPPTPAPTPTPEPVAYPLGPLAVPDFAAPGEPFTLSDLAYGLVDDFGTEQFFRARVRYRDRAFLGAEVSGERRGLALMSHRLSLSAFASDGRLELGGEYRGRRLVLATEAVRRGAPDQTWRIRPSLAVRPLGALELEAWLVTDSERPADRRRCQDDVAVCRGRLLTSFGGDLFWQHGAGLELLGGVARRYELTGRLNENRIDNVRLLALSQLGRLELRGGYSLDDVTGRFPRRESELSLEARLPLAGRLLLDGAARNRLDHGLGELQHDYGGGLTWFGRRVTLPRSGRASERAAALARQARARGEYELGAFEAEALRSQRERLSLSSERDALREEVEATHRAQIEERLVPLLGLAYRHTDDGMTGERVHTARALLGVPWPPALPWRAREGCAPFLQLELEHRWHTTGPELASGTNAVALTVALNREMDLVARWSRSAATALDILRGVSRHERFEVSYVYARGR